MTPRQMMNIKCNLLRSHRSAGKSWLEKFPRERRQPSRCLRDEWECPRQEGRGIRGRGPACGRQEDGKAGRGPTWLQNMRERGAKEASDHGAVRSRQTVCLGLGDPRRQSSPKPLPEATLAPSCSDAVRLLGGHFTEPSAFLPEWV